MKKVLGWDGKTEPEKPGRAEAGGREAWGSQKDPSKVGGVVEIGSRKAHRIARG